MKSNRRNMTPHPAGQRPFGEDGHMHFRLCHLCMHLNEADQEISECSECQHAFKDEILTQFFRDRDDESFSDAAPDDSEGESTSESSEEDPDDAKPVRDLNGLSVRF